MLTLHTLPAIPGRKKKRVGRGDSSRGNYSGRGAKGQRSRSGGKGGLKLRGLKQSMMALPKSRGFSSLVKRSQVVNLEKIEKVFAAGATIDKQALFDKKLIKSMTQPVKILGNGKITKVFTVKVQAASQSAQDAIIKAGGTITVSKIKRQPTKSKKKTA